MKEVEVKFRECVDTIECDQNPRGKKAMCWMCQTRHECKPYITLKQQTKTEYGKNLRNLKEHVKKILKPLFDQEQAEIIEEGHEICRECPEKPRECIFCLQDARMFKHFKQPYIKILIKAKTITPI